MNNLDTMLAYQEIDIKLKRAYDALEKSEASDKMEQARNKFNSAKKTVLEVKNPPKPSLKLSNRQAINLRNSFKSLPNCNS